jgi:Na+-transporting methylmalonyl-CoA/oxaloacetate decarboxylase gamma subunit
MEDSLMVGIRLTVVGMVVVFIGMGLLIAFLYFFQRLDQWIHRPAAATQEPETLPTAFDPELVAVLSAAAFVALGQPVRIRRIQYSRPQRDATWSKQGRMTIMGSHVTRR